MGNPPITMWLDVHPTARLATFADAAAEADVVVNATSGAGAIPALEQAGADTLADKVLVDISKPPRLLGRPSSDPLHQGHLLPVWLRLMAALGTPAFNFKIVR